MTVLTTGITQKTKRQIANKEAAGQAVEKRLLFLYTYLTYLKRYNMKQFTATQLKQKLGDLLYEANHRPVSITNRGREAFVLMSYAEYQKLKKGNVNENG